MVFPSGARSSESVALLGGKPYMLVTEEQAKAVDGVKRAWDVRRVTRQSGDPEPEFEVPLETYSLGYGISYALLPGGYERANGWDASAPGKLASWPRLSTGEAFATNENVRSWEYYNYASGYYYLFRGGYALKYEIDPTPDSEWPIIEIHYFGDDRVVSGKWGEFNGKVYVPLIDPTDDGEERFEQLDTISTTTTEVQTVVISGTPTAGTYTLTFNAGTALTTSALAYNASGSAVQAALRLLPGLEKVTVVTTGSTPNFTHTVTMTAAPSLLGSTTPPQMTNTDNTTGGSHAIANATTVAGVGDEWNLGPANILARYFATWNKPGVGPTLALCVSNNVRLVSDDPMTEADWGAAYAIDNSTYRCTSLAVWDRYLMVGKQNGLYSFDEQAVAVLETKDLAGVIDDANFVGMVEASGYLLCPHKNGLLRWRPGSYRFIGAEQEGLFEGETSSGWGPTVGVSPFGKYTYITVTDPVNEDGIISSLVSPGSQVRGPLTPHMHHQFEGSAEDIISTTLQSNPPRPSDVATGTDDNAVGTIAWTDPSNIAVADAEVTAAGPGITHYLKALMPAVTRVPTDATINGIQIDIDRSSPDALGSITVVGTETVVVTGVDPPVFVIPVPAGSTTGDVLFCTVVANVTITGTPAGWTQIAKTQPRSGEDMLLLYRLATGAEPANYTITFDGGGNHGVGSITTRRGVDLTTVIDVTPVAGTAVTSGTTVTAPTLTTVTAGARLVSAFAARTGNAAFSTPAGMTERMDSSDTAVYTLAVFDEAITPAGATGTRASTYSINPIAWGRAVSYAIRPATSASDIVDNVVRLVVGGSVTGSDLADTVTLWPFTRTTKVYGGPTELWGLTPTVAQVNAATFGFVLSADITAGDATLYGIAQVTIYYTASNGVAGSVLIAVQVAADGLTTTPFAYELPRAGMPVANDPGVGKAVSDKTFHTSRIFAPSRNTQKTYRSVEFYAGLSPEMNTPGLQMWASVDDGDFFALLDEDGATLTCDASGDYEGFFPDTTSAVGRWVQLRPTVPALAGLEVPVAVTLRDVTLHGSWSPKTTDYVTAVFILKDSPKFSDGTTDRRTAKEQREDLMALYGPRPAGAGLIPIALHDPETGENTTCVVTGVPRIQRIRFQNASDPEWVAVVNLRKTPRATA